MHFAIIFFAPIYFPSFEQIFKSFHWEVVATYLRNVEDNKAAYSPQCSLDKFLESSYLIKMQSFISNIERKVLRLLILI